MNTTTVPVVVVTHAGPSEHTRRCLRSLVDAGGADPIVVVDNSGRHTNVDDYGGLPDSVVNTKNRGYGAAANVGFATAWKLAPVAQAVALFNDDIEVDSAWLPPLAAALAGGAAVAQPRLFRAPRSPEPMINSLGVELDESGAGTDIGNGERATSFDISGRQIEMFIGGAVLFDREFIAATGGFDERYFLYYEDVDLALRGAELGFHYRCEPTSVVWHVGGASTNGLGAETRRLQERNRLWCAVRFGKPPLIGRAFWLSVRRLRHAPHGAHLRALLAGVAGAPRRFFERRGARRNGGNAS